MTRHNTCNKQNWMQSFYLHFSCSGDSVNWSPKLPCLLFFDVQTNHMRRLSPTMRYAAGQALRLFKACDVIGTLQPCLRHRCCKVSGRCERGKSYFKIWCLVIAVISDIRSCHRDTAVSHGNRSKYLGFCIVVAPIPQFRVRRLVFGFRHTHRNQDFNSLSFSINLSLFAVCGIINVCTTSDFV